jgi:hypothetical protein
MGGKVILINESLFQGNRKHHKNLVVVKIMGHTFQILVPKQMTEIVGNYGE